MQPNEQPLPPDYLDQIAPKSTRQFNFFKKKPVIIGAIVLGFILLIVVFMSISSMLSTSLVKSEKLYARLSATQDVTKSAADNIKSSKLRGTNSQLNLDLSNMTRDLDDILAKEGVNAEKLGKDITVPESSTDMLDTLEDARLNDNYDEVYIREMKYQLQNIISLMQELDKSSNSSATKKFISSSESDLLTIQKSIANFSLIDN